MIKNGQQELELQEHQQDAYNAVQKTYEQGNRAAVVIPTGCGKSFIALKLMEDNRDKNILFLAPTIAIKNQMYNYIAKYIVGEEPTSERPAKKIAEEHFPNLVIRSYPSLLKVSDENMEKYHADIIIMDELHRTGAEKWGEKVNTLLEKNPNAKILGLTATPERMDEQNVIDKLFEGNISYELTLVEALRRGILKSPKYVKCDYALGEYIEGLNEAIDSCSDEKTKRELQEKVEKMRRIVEKAEGIPELFKNNIQKKDGKYIIFCKDKEHMELLQSKVSEWFGEIDSEPEIYSVYSGNTERKNSKTIKEFEESKSEHLKLLFSIDMLNEGVHIEGVSGVIMARPTDSRIVYLQQLGRALSSDPSGEQTIIFDLVNNYVKNNLDAEVNGRDEDISHGNEENTIIGENGEKSEKSQPGDIDIFKIQGETLKFLELLEEIKEIINRSTYLKNAEAILEWIKRQEKPKLPSEVSENEEEKKLGIAWSSIRTNLINPYKEKTTAEEQEKFREKYPEIDDVLKIIKEIKISTSTHYLNAQRILEWIKSQEEPKMPSEESENKEERTLKRALRSIRERLIKPYEKKTTDEEREEFREEHPEIDDVLKIIKEIKISTAIYYLNAQRILEWIKRQEKPKLPSKHSQNEEEKKLGSALDSIRTNLIKSYKKKTTAEEREQFKEEHPEIDAVLEIIKEIDISTSTQYLNAQAIQKWIKRQEKPKLPSEVSENEEEKKLGLALRGIRSQLIKPYMEKPTAEEREKFREEHPEIDDVLKIIKEIKISTSTQYLNAQAIQEWIKRQEKPKLPSRESKNKEERTLGNALKSIRTRLIKPYMEKTTNEEREKFREEYPETDAVLEIVSDIDIKYGTKKQKELAELIKQDLEKRRESDEAKKLEEENGVNYIKYFTKRQKELVKLIKQYLEKMGSLDEARKLEEQYEQLVADTKDKDKKNGVDFNGE